MNRSALWAGTALVGVLAAIATPVSAQVKVGDKAPAFSAELVSYGPFLEALKKRAGIVTDEMPSLTVEFDFSDPIFGDQIVALVFWRTSSDRCIRAIPSLTKIHHMDAKIVGLLAISDEPEEKVDSYLRKHKTQFQVACCAKPVTFTYGVSDYPLVFLIQNGRVAWKGNPSMAEKKIKSLWEDSRQKETQSGVKKSRYALRYSEANRLYKDKQYFKALEAYEKLAKMLSAGKYAKKARAKVKKMKANDHIMKLAERQKRRAMFSEIHAALVKLVTPGSSLPMDYRFVGAKISSFMRKVPKIRDSDTYRLYSLLHEALLRLSPDMFSPKHQRRLAKHLQQIDTLKEEFWELRTTAFCRACEGGKASHMNRKLVLLMELLQAESALHRSKVHDRQSYIHAAEMLLVERDQMLVLYGKILAMWERELDLLTSEGADLAEDSLKAAREASEAFGQAMASPNDEELKEASDIAISESSQLVEKLIEQSGRSHAMELFVKYCEFSAATWRHWADLTRCVSEMTGLALEFTLCPKCDGEGQVRKSDADIERETERAVAESMRTGRSSRVVKRYRNCSQCGGYGRQWDSSVFERERELFRIWNDVPTDHELIGDLITSIRGMEN